MFVNSKQIIDHIGLKFLNNIFFQYSLGLGRNIWVCSVVEWNCKWGNLEMNMVLKWGMASAYHHTIEPSYIWVDLVQHAQPILAFLSLDRLGSRLIVFGPPRQSRRDGDPPIWCLGRLSEHWILKVFTNGRNNDHISNQWLSRHTSNTIPVLTSI